MSIKPVCPVCGAAQRDWLLCETCLSSLVALLTMAVPDPERAAVLVADRHGTYRIGRTQTLPWEDLGPWQGIEAELRTSFLRQSKRALNIAGTQASGATSLPFDDRAQRRLEDLRNTLGTWIRVLIAEGEEWPADDLAAMAGWLISERKRIRIHPAARQIHRDIDHAVNRCLSVIGQPPPRDYLGRCQVCDADLYCEPGADETTCLRCKTVVTGIKARKEHRLRQALDGLATRTEILAMLPHSFGVSVSQSRFSNWLDHGRIHAKGRTPDGYPTYRLSDVVALARNTRGRRKERTMTK